MHFQLQDRLDIRLFISLRNRCNLNKIDVNEIRIKVIVENSNDIYLTPAMILFRIIFIILFSTYFTFGFKKR